MKKNCNPNLSSGAGLDLSSVKKRCSNSSSTHKTNSESNTCDGDASSTNSRVRIKKKSRKVRCTQDFNHMDRRSIVPSKTTGSESVEKVTTKKKKNMDFLPRVCFEIDGQVEKENFSPNIETGASGDEPRAKKIRKKKDSSLIYLPTVDMTVVNEKKASLPRNANSTPEDERDSEIVFKKRKKKSKKTKDVTSASPPNAIKNQIEPKKERKLSSKLQRKSPNLTKKHTPAKASILSTDIQQELLNAIPVDCGKHSISSGDVYIEETNQTFEIDQNSSNTKVKLNPDLEQKSVRFRNTFEVQDITTTSTCGSKSVTFEDSNRDESSFKRYRKSPHVRKFSSKLSNSGKTAKRLSPDKADTTRGNIAIISPSLREHVSRKIDYTVQNRRSTFEMPSPILGPEKTVKSSRFSSCSRHKTVIKDISIIDLLTPSPKRSKLSDIAAATPSKLFRESTFTMDERVANQASESIQPVDMSKSNGRRRWDKSLGVSFLDSSGNLHSISPPWTEEPIDLSVSKDTPKENRKMLPKERVSIQKPQKTTPTAMSTNLSGNKKHSLRSELLKDNCNGKINQSRNGTMKRPKMPNFALIHQRAFDKMENLKEMSERKAERAKLLLSGLKPVSEAPTKAKSPAKSKKMLLYSPKLNLPVTKPVRSPINTKTIALKSPRNSRPVVPSTSNPKVAPKLLEKKSAVSHIPKPPKNKNFAEKQKFTKLGFKVGADAAKKTTKEEQVKAVANKSKVQTNTVDTRRNVIQNVRSNRRFELLMKMRNK